MDLFYSMGAAGTVNNQNSSIGCYVGLGLKQDKISMRGDVGTDLSAKGGCPALFTKGTISYNSDDGDVNADNGFFANGSAQFETGIGMRTVDYGYGYESDEFGVINYGKTLSAELGYRLNPNYSGTHTNLSVFADSSTFNNQVNNTYGAKGEISDGNKSMFTKVGIQKNEKDTKPYIGIGAKINLTAGL